MSIKNHNPATSSALALPFILALVILLLLQSPGGCQERSRSAGAAQPQSVSGEMKAFRDGRELLLQENWPRAAERFNDFITDYPKDPNVDAALYWLAFALNKQDKLREADRALNRLITEFPSSTWADDAKALRMEIAPRLGHTDLVDKEAKASNNEEARLVALRNLFSDNPEQAIAISSDVLLPGSGATRSFKESTIMMLGRYGGKRALPLLSDVARRESESLRKSAIYWLGKEEDANTLAVLKDLALTATETGVGIAALSAILQQGSPQALESLNEISGAAVSPEVRKRAGSLLRANAAGSSRNATKDSWLLLRGERQLLLISTGRIIKLTGSGTLKFKRDGQLLEVPNGLSVTVDGDSPFQEGAVRKGESADVVGGEIVSRERLIQANEVVHLVNKDQQTVWTLSLAPAEDANMLENGNWFTINGEFNVSAAELKAFFLYAKPGGGVKMR